jgi:hypothetical protein
VAVADLSRVASVESIVRPGEVGSGELRQLTFVYAGCQTYQLGVELSVECTRVDFGDLPECDRFSPHERLDCLADVPI